MTVSFVKHDSSDDSYSDATGDLAIASGSLQPLDSDLSAIAGLSPTNDDVIQRKAGAWTNRSIAQLLTDLGAAGTTFQPLDSDLSAIAALSTTSFGRSLLALADASALSQASDRRGLDFISGLIAQGFDRTEATANTTILSTGRIQAQAIPVLAGDLITNVSFWQGTTAFTAATNAWFALLDSSVNVIRQSTDQLTAGITANTAKTLAVDSLPVTAGSRSGTSTVTLTFPTLSQALTSLIAASDSVVVSNANIAAYNGTFSVVTVSSTQITYVSGGSATDSLSAPFPTVQLAAGKRTYTVPTDGYLYAAIMLAGTVGTHFGNVNQASNALVPILNYRGATGLTGTCPSPATVSAASALGMWAAIS